MTENENLKAEIQKLTDAQVIGPEIATIRTNVLQEGYESVLFRKTGQLSGSLFQVQIKPKQSVSQKKMRMKTKRNKFAYVQKI